ncbi:unnamed protein product [Moneuplotes crassus]|uniref:Uncharacterized protein n=1 Tax=Euplotes crassus TaxID=5936 RepID=A0AAD1Y5A4_EUPCR|nr:unnamed protein product [Moneuplotes crassus]
MAFLVKIFHPAYVSQRFIEDILHVSKLPKLIKGFLVFKFSTRYCILSIITFWIS